MNLAVRRVELDVFQQNGLRACNQTKPSIDVAKKNYLLKRRSILALSRWRLMTSHALPPTAATRNCCCNCPAGRIIFQHATAIEPSLSLFQHIIIISARMNALPALAGGGHLQFRLQQADTLESHTSFSGWSCLCSAAARQWRRLPLRDIMHSHTHTETGKAS